MEWTGPRAQGAGLIVGIGLFLTIALVVGTLFIVDTLPYDLSGAVFVGPLLFAITVPILAREAARQRDRRLLGFLILALLVKFIGTLIRYYVTFNVYGTADARAFHREGVWIAEQLKAGTYDLDLGSLSSSAFIKFFTGVVYTIIGPTKLGGFLVYSWLAFLGLFFFYRAFTIAIPEGRARTYGRLLFFLPSLVYWPSSIGKESWMVFTLGIAAFGAARSLSGRTGPGLVLAGLGTWLMALVRPHVAGMLAIGLAAGYILQRRRKDSRVLVPVARIAGFSAATLLAVFLIVRTADFLDLSQISPTGIVSELEDVAQRADQGGSRFEPTVVRSPTDLPIALVTVLFRPFITETHNAQAAAAALESAFLLIFSLARIRWIWAAVKSARRQPYVALGFVYTILFVVGFAAFPNFGLLARQRVQLLPFYLVLLSIPTSKELVSPEVIPVPAPREVARSSDHRSEGGRT